jgi:redox-sensing transcriptional repressor
MQRGKLEHVCPLRAGIDERDQWVWRVARHIEHREVGGSTLPRLPLKTLMRFRWYVTALGDFAEHDIDIISSRELADKVGVGAPMVRKDLSYVGDLGTPGLGYQVSYLQERLHQLLEHQTCLLAWVGAEWLSNLLTTFAPAVDLNFRIVAAFDTRPEWIGKKVGQWEVLPLSDLGAVFSNGNVDGAVLALPEFASRVADELVEAGARGILNMTPSTLSLPPHVSVRQVDLVGEMMALAMTVSDDTRLPRTRQPARPFGARAAGRQSPAAVSAMPELTRQSQ